MSQKSDKEIDLFNLSFIDLLSCGLGGVLLLLLLFATMVREQVAKNIKAAAVAGDTLVTVDLGKEVPPPLPLTFKLSWNRPVPVPPKLSIYPPMVERTNSRGNSRITCQLPWKAEGRALTEELPFANEGNRRYRVIFFREASNGGGGTIVAVIPNISQVTQRLMLSENKCPPEGTKLLDVLKQWTIKAELQDEADLSIGREMDRIRSVLALVRSQSIRLFDSSQHSFNIAPMSKWNPTLSPAEMIVQLVNDAQGEVYRWANDGFQLTSADDQSVIGLYAPQDFIAADGDRLKERRLRRQSLLLRDEILSELQNLSVKLSGGQMEAHQALIASHAKLESFLEEEGLNWQDDLIGGWIGRWVTSEVDLASNPLGELFRMIRQYGRSMVGVGESDVPARFTATVVAPEGREIRFGLADKDLRKAEPNLEAGEAIFGVFSTPESERYPVPTAIELSGSIPPGE